VTPTRARVLIADDHPGFVKALERVLSLDCDVVGVVSDGGAVAETAAQLQPVVAVVDVNLPTISGLDACRSILQANPRAKVILMTAIVDDAIRNEALIAGAFGFFSKLMAASELLDAIRNAWADCALGGDSLQLNE
jgi:two-component system invasion response regulator UvrY